MRKKLIRFGMIVIAIAATTSTIYSAQGPDLRAEIAESASQVAGGRRVEVSAGANAPFSGVLLDDTALERIWEEVTSLRDEIESLRAALEAQKTATDIENTRAEMWKAERSSPVWGRIGLYGWTACAGALAGAIISRQP